MFHAAGSLHGGRKAWALVKLPEELVVVPDDAAHRYLLLVTARVPSLIYALPIRPGL
jgi:Domain of unknown function (DUF932)